MTMSDTLHHLRRENAWLHQQTPKLVSPIDHYHAAYREVKALLDRRERELADLCRGLDLKPVFLRR